VNLVTQTESGFNGDYKIVGDYMNDDDAYGVVEID
jgi:hypothetical protein